MKLSEVAKIVSGELGSDPSVVITNIQTLESAKEDSLCFVLDKKFLAPAEQSKAAVLIISKKQKSQKPFIAVDSPRLAMAQLLPHFSKRKKIKPGIHPQAVIEKSVKIGKDVYVGPFVYIGEDTTIGDNVVIHANASIYDNVEIGNNVIIHSSAVLGVDGYGFIPTKNDPIKIPQTGKLIIEDNVEVYAGSCIARGAIGETRIGKGTKIDNLTHIAHNCKIGKACLITAQVGFAGSVTFGDHVMVAGQSAFNGHINVGSNCIVLGKSGVTKNIPDNSVISGFPAQEHKKELKNQAKLRKLLDNQ